MTDTESQEEPVEERGEDPQSHLLPNLERLRTMAPEDRYALRDLVADWEGPLVEEFRGRIAELDLSHES